MCFLKNLGLQLRAFYFGLHDLDSVVFGIIVRFGLREKTVQNVCVSASLSPVVLVDVAD